MNGSPALSDRPPWTEASDSRRGLEIRSTVAVLTEELGSEAVCDLVQTFLEDTPLRIEEIRGLAGTPDQVTLRRAAHSLKGSAALFGALRLEACALHLEESACRQDLTTQRADADLIHRIYHEETRPILEGLLRQMTL